MYSITLWVSSKLLFFIHFLLFFSTANSSSIIHVYTEYFVMSFIHYSGIIIIICYINDNFMYRTCLGDVLSFIVI